jgi:release factor glutamine methyltransferase
MGPQTVLQQLTERLAPLSETGRLDAQVLLAHVLGRPRAWVLAHPEAGLSPEEAQDLESAARRLEAGEALPYVIGRWEFFGMEFELETSDRRTLNAERRRAPVVLIPRPETEVLVEGALAWLRQNPGRRRACDVGTGSGCIAIALAAHVADLQVTATDISPAALAVAAENARRHGVEGRVQLVEADLLPPGGGRYDLICANLPYIPSTTLLTLEVYQREPALALDGGPDGLALIRRLVQQAPERLAPGGRLMLEIEASQGQAAAALAPGAKLRILRDLAGKERVVEMEFEGDIT